MSKLTQIEKQLQAVDQATFQELCDALLHARGYGGITRVGSAIGASKVVKGTPDTRFLQPDGQYIFVEYTTQQTRTGAKLLKDLRKCFGKKTTGIPTSRIREVILCHNTKLTTAEEGRLIDECARNGAGCLILGLNNISLDLYNSYPNLARDFLGISIDTGQILGRDTFVQAYNKSAIAPPLDTAFRFRDEDMTKALAALDEAPILIITGRAGVGKTRFALELFSKVTLESNGMSWVDSKVPVLEERAEFWRSARSIFGSLELLGHRKIVDEALERACAEIDRVKRHEFIEDE